ncbi:putative membrane protein [Oceanobacillus limi]|uniref:Putative membrane protein n=2 Tax=Oceanobacillus limi TaxID=930131 RepID=A0A1I0H9Y3_9BACI|nr:putative membrane protein [Oceanobacillus limi]
MMSEQRRLHPAAIIFNFIKAIREALFVIIISFISFKDDYLFYYLLVVAGLVLIILTISVLSWYRYTYRLVDDELQIEYGIIVRKKRYISKNRIQSIDLTASVIHRIFKLVKVQIETAGSGMSAEATLKAVTVGQGEQLRRELKVVQQGEGGEDFTRNQEELDSPSKQISWNRLFVAGSTSGSIGVILALLAFGLSEIEQFLPDQFFNQTFEWVIGLGISIVIVLAIIVLFVLYLLGIAGTMIKYGNFTIQKNKEELFITRGLLEKKQLTIPLKRIQAIGVQESIIRQPLGYVTVFAEVAGGSLDKGEDFSTVLFPIMKREEVDAFLQEFIPTYVSERTKLHPLPKRALKFYLFRSVIPFFIVAALVLYFYPQFIWGPVILLLASLYLGLLRHRAGGFRTEEKLLTIRYRVLSKNTMIIVHKRIQSYEKKQHKLQKSQQLATLNLSIIGKLGVGKHYKLKDLAVNDVDLLADWYSYRKKG